MIKKLFVCLFFLFAFWVTPFVQSETFNDEDILGLWHLFMVDVHPIMGVYWLYADIDSLSSSDFTGTIFSPDGSTMAIESGEALIFPDGNIAGSFTTDSGITSTIINGLQDQLHTIFGTVLVDSEDALGLGLGIKAGGTYHSSDMAGDWRFYGLQVDPNIPGLYWVVGDGTIDADGNLSAGRYTGPDSTVIDIKEGSFSIEETGKVAGSIEFDNGTISQVVAGMMDRLKTFAVFVDVDNEERLGFDLALKKGGDYLPSDLEGDWRFFNFTIDVANEIAYPLYGSATIDKNGNITGNYTAPDASEFSISNGQASISSDGELAGFFTIEGVADATIQSGFMDQNKSIFVYVGTSDNDQMDLGIGFRTSDIPVDEIDNDDVGGGGGSSGGCFITDIAK